MSTSPMVERVPVLLKAALEGLVGARDALQTGAREVTWAYQDLQAAGQLPDGSNEPSELDRDSQFSEFATRVVLPRHLPTAEQHVLAALAAIRELVTAVPPLPTKETKP